MRGAWVAKAVAKHGPRRNEMTPFAALDRDQGQARREKYASHAFLRRSGRAGQTTSEATGWPTSRLNRTQQIQPLFFVGVFVHSALFSILCISSSDRPK